MEVVASSIPMKIVYENYVRLGGLGREEAEALLKLLPKNDSFKSLIADLEYGLAPRYVYRVQCTECRNSFLMESLTKLPPSQTKKSYGICASCSDDFK